VEQGEKVFLQDKIIKNCGLDLRVEGLLVVLDLVPGELGEVGVDVDNLVGAAHLDARLLGVHDLLAPVEDVRQLGAVRVGGTAGAVHAVLVGGGGGVRGNGHVVGPY